MALTCTQDIAMILDPKYVPITKNDKDLFLEKQKNMLAVFDWTLLTNTGKTLIQELENVYDAQSIHKAIVKYYLISTKASLISSSLHHFGAAWF